jgi:uncharacterized membrane protein
VGGTIGAEARALFALVADYQQAPTFIDGLQSLDPLTDDTVGEGAEFAAVMKVGPKVFHATITIARLREDRLITWAAVGEHDQAITFKLKPVDNGTQILMEVSYERPAGLTGTITAPIVEETVRNRAHASMRRLRDQVVAEA